MKWQLKDGNAVDELSVSGMNDMKEKKVPCEIYSRIVGYLRPLKNWHKGKTQEFDDRMTFKVNKDYKCLCQSQKKSLLSENVEADR